MTTTNTIPNEVATEPKAMQGLPSHRRRLKHPKPGLQLRLIGAFGGLCLLGLLTQALVMGVLLTGVAETLPSDSTRVAEALPSLLVRTIFVSAALVLPALLVIGIRVTFRVAGPIKRFELHLASVAKGEWTGPCRLRKGDELHDLCEGLNAGLEAARAMPPLEELESAEAA